MRKLSVLALSALLVVSMSGFASAGLHGNTMLVTADVDPTGEIIVTKGMDFNFQTDDAKCLGADGIGWDDDYLASLADLSGWPCAVRADNDPNTKDWSFNTRGINNDGPYGEGMVYVIGNGPLTVTMTWDSAKSTNWVRDYSGNQLDTVVMIHREDRHLNFDGSQPLSNFLGYVTNQKLANTAATKPSASFDVTYAEIQNAVAVKNLSGAPFNVHGAIYMPDGKWWQVPYNKDGQEYKATLAITLSANTQ